MNRTQARLMPLVRRGSRPVCVMLPGAGGGLHPYLGLAGVLGRTFNVYGVRAAGLEAGEEADTTIVGMAESALALLDDAGIVPDLVFGWSLGGVVGWELTVRLAERGLRPDVVILDASSVPRSTPDEVKVQVVERIVAMLGPDPTPDAVARVADTTVKQIDALIDYRSVTPYDGRALYIQCTSPEPLRAPSVACIQNLSSDFRTAVVDADHLGVLNPVHLPDLEAVLTEFTRPQDDGAHLRQAA